MKNFLLWVGSLQTMYCAAQINETVIFLNDQGITVKERKATYLQQQFQVSDSLWEVNLYRLKGPKVLSYQTKDKQGTIKNGDYTTYHYGFRDTMGRYANNIRIGKWILFSPANTVVKELNYDQGVLAGELDSANWHQKLPFPEIPDSTSPTDSKVEFEATFKGGQQEWLHYLIHNLHYPERASEGRIQGVVVVGFAVDQQGKISKPQIIRSVEYSLDKESLRLINTSPDWTPAAQNGQFVRSYKYQPISFRVVMM
jgi:periplasmic protein TonB